MMSSSGFQRVNGLKLWVHRFREESAPPSGLTILLLHGFMDAGGTWDMVAPALARGGHEVVAPDLRGFGLSDSIGAGGYYHFPDYVADVAELVDALAPRRLAVVGHSMGATVAAYYAGAHRDRVERLALLEGMGPMATPAPVSVDRMVAWLRTLREVSRVPRPLSSLQEAVERLSLHHPRVPRDVIETRARLLTKADDTGRLVWAYDPLHRTTAPTPFHAESFKEFLRRIDCPTLVVSGGPSGWHPPDEAERVACLVQGTRFELASAGHMMHWTEPRALSERLAAFFGEAPRVRAPSVSEPHIGTELPLSAQPSHGGIPPASSPISPPQLAAVPSSHGGYGTMPMYSVSAAPAGAPAAGPGHTVVPGGPPAGQIPVGPTRPAAGVTRDGTGKTGG
jgi:pimeloyl-ACP methyl ester carboxylesterase